MNCHPDHRCLPDAREEEDRAGGKRCTVEVAGIEEPDGVLLPHDQQHLDCHYVPYAAVQGCPGDQVASHCNCHQHRLEPR